MEQNVIEDRLIPALPLFPCSTFHLTNKKAFTLKFISKANGCLDRRKSRPDLAEKPWRGTDATLTVEKKGHHPARRKRPRRESVDSWRHPRVIGIKFGRASNTIHSWPSIIASISKSRNPGLYTFGLGIGIVKRNGNEDVVEEVVISAGIETFWDPVHTKKKT